MTTTSKPRRLPPKGQAAKEILRAIAARGLSEHAQRIASKYGIDVGELPCSTLHAIAKARREFWSQLYDSGVYSFRQIAELFGRDPKTVSDQVRKYEEEAWSGRAVINGVERTIAEWSRISGTPKAQIRRHIAAGVKAADAVWGRANISAVRRTA